MQLSRVIQSSDWHNTGFTSIFI